MAILEIKEVLRHWLRGRAKRLIARRLGLDVKTVRKYVRVAEEHGLTPGPETALTGEVLFAVFSKVYRWQLGRPRGEGWRRCSSHREDIKRLLDNRISCWGLFQVENLAKGRIRTPIIWKPKIGVIEKIEKLETNAH
jgi:hypothetical protein